MFKTQITLLGYIADTTETLDFADEWDFPSTVDNEPLFCDFWNEIILKTF